PRLRCQVDAVDTQDSRLVTDGYAFRLVSGTALPFADAAFDVILSNHVIEHVGQRESQKHHLDELKRVLRPEGIVYLAVPNRWMLVEPHYGLAFLSWWPTSWRTPWLRLWKKGEYYDCEPLAVRELEGLLQESGFRFRNVSVEATRLFYEIEKPDALLTRGLRRMPDAVLAALRPVIPTLCYVLEKRHCSSPPRHS
ncbi:MAG: methyltransferase domain-containing protein, partial [Azoarcus sp.]|nr:methyltransferase domain-containing protein [Azoarcus sp.]